MEHSLNFNPTNTMTSSSFDILKMDGIEDPLININKLATIDLEESYYEEALRFISESNVELTNAKLELYNILRESTDDTVILEGFSDFFTKIKEIIDKFLKFIKNLFSRFLANLSHLVQSDKFIKKNKDIFSKFNSDCEFDFAGYEYTFNIGVPLATAALSFNSSLFNDLTANSDGVLTASNVNSLVHNLNFEKEYDLFRGRVIGKGDNYPIPAVDFNDELFKIYRNDSIDTEDLTVDSARVMNSYNRFIEFKETKKQVEREQKEIERTYNQIKDQVKDITRRNGDLNVQAFISRLPDNTGVIDVDKTNDGIMMSSELMLNIDLYVKAKTEQIQQFTNIHVLAYSAKLDALQACCKQDKNMLYAAYNQILKKGANK